MRIRRHPLEAKQKCRAERDDIICSLPQRYNRNLIFSNFFLLFLNAAGKFFNRLIIKIYICQCRKQSVHQKAVCFFRMLSVFFGRFRQLNKFIHQLILQFRRLRLFATDSGIDTTFISGGLLALKTKHIWHNLPPIFLLMEVLSFSVNSIPAIQTASYITFHWVP